MVLAFKKPWYSEAVLRSDLETTRDRIFDQLLDEAVRKVARARDAEVRRMLGEWVSELEPGLVYGPGGQLLGIGRAGTGEVTIRARPIELIFLS